MRVLHVTNMIYALVMPVIEIFVGAYVMRNSNDVKMVIGYQLAVYTGIPFTFYVTGKIETVSSLSVSALTMQGTEMPAA
ncbi:MAG: hypothetical protein ACOYM3_05445 [Terrimicrobiaceae bacterium]